MSSLYFFIFLVSKVERIRLLTAKSIESCLRTYPDTITSTIDQLLILYKEKVCVLVDIYIYILC
jgi:hypothetical protein